MKIEYSIGLERPASIGEMDVLKPYYIRKMGSDQPPLIAIRSGDKETVIYFKPEGLKWDYVFAIDDEYVVLGPVPSGTEIKITV